MAERYWASLEETVDEMEMVIPTRNRLLLLAVRDLKAIAYDMREEESDRCLNEIEAIHLCIQNYKEWLSRRPNLPHSHRDENHNNTQKAIPESHIQKPMPTLEAPNPTTPNYESSGAAATSNGLESEQKITGPGLHLRKQPNFQPRVPKRAPPSESGQTAKKPKLSADVEQYYVYIVSKRRSPDTPIKSQPTDYYFPEAVLCEKSLTLKTLLQGKREGIDLDDAMIYDPEVTKSTKPATLKLLHYDKIIYWEDLLKHCAQNGDVDAIDILGWEETMSWAALGKWYSYIVNDDWTTLSDDALEKERAIVVAKFLKSQGGDYMSNLSARKVIKPTDQNGPDTTILIFKTHENPDVPVKHDKQTRRYPILENLLCQNSERFRLLLKAHRLCKLDSPEFPNEDIVWDPKKSETAKRFITDKVIYFDNVVKSYAESKKNKNAIKVSKMSEGDIWFSLGVFWSWLLGRGIQLADCSFEKDRALVMADFLLASKEYYAELNAHKVRQRVYDDEEKEKLRIRGRLNQLRHLFD